MDYNQAFMSQLQKKIPLLYKLSPDDMLWHLNRSLDNFPASEQPINEQFIRKYLKKIKREMPYKLF